MGRMADGWVRFDGSGIRYGQLVVECDGGEGLTRRQREECVHS